MLRQFSGKQQAHRRLDFAAGDRRATVVMRQTRCLGSDALEYVVDKTVHYRHGFAADARVRVDLLENLVDVNGVALPSSSLLLLIAGANGLRLAGRLLGSLARGFRWHDADADSYKNDTCWATETRAIYIKLGDRNVT